MKKDSPSFSHIHLEKFLFILECCFIRKYYEQGRLQHGGFAFCSKRWLLGRGKKQKVNTEITWKLPYRMFILLLH